MKPRCSLVYAHRGILKQISSGNAEALILEVSCSTTLVASRMYCFWPPA